MLVVVIYTSRLEVAQVVPIYKKDDPIEPNDYKSISLTSIFRKILELCLYQLLVENSLPLDLVQNGFCEVRGSLDQAIHLAEICNILHWYHCVTPVLTFLDIKSAYDTVDRNYIWQRLEHTTSMAFICLLRNLLHNVQIEVLRNNATSTRFSLATVDKDLYSRYSFTLTINSRRHLSHPTFSSHELHFICWRRSIHRK